MCSVQIMQCFRARKYLSCQLKSLFSREQLAFGRCEFRESLQASPLLEHFPVGDPLFWIVSARLQNGTLTLGAPVVQPGDHSAFPPRNLGPARFRLKSSICAREIPATENAGRAGRAVLFNVELSKHSVLVLEARPIAIAHSTETTIATGARPKPARRDVEES